jgi:ABC-type Mn2+/Zn2+ transport system ATPase subunit
MKKTNECEYPAKLVLENVMVSYNGSNALEDLSFDVPQGAMVAVIGPNGAGKSTLFKALVSLLPLKNGSIQIHDKPLGQHLDCIAYIPQREEVDWHFPVTVEGVVLMGRYGKLGWLHSISNQDRQVADQAMQQMGISDLKKKRLDELSGGQQQRVFLARAIAQEPHILIMDEPFNGVDINTQEATLAVLEKLSKNNVTVLVSTHDLNLAGERFSTVLLLNHKLIAYGPPDKVLRSEYITKAFGSHAVSMNGSFLIDECCAPDHPGGHK